MFENENTVFGTSNHEMPRLPGDVVVQPGGASVEFDNSRRVGVTVAAALACARNLNGPDPVIEMIENIRNT